MPFSFSNTVVLKRGVDGRGVLLDASTGAIFTLNRTSALICEAINQGAGDLDSVIKFISEKMELPAEAKSDIKAYINLLQDKKLLTENAAK